MSRRNGARARADRKYTEKLHKRTYIRELRKRLQVAGSEEREKNDKAPVMQGSAL